MSEQVSKGWRYHTDHRTPRHVWPENDMTRHVVNGQQCWCKPATEDGVVIHHSLDGREEREIEPRFVTRIPGG